MHESLDFVTVECSIHKSYTISFDKVASVLFSCLMKDNVMFFFNLLCEHNIKKLYVLTYFFTYGSDDIYMIL